MEDSYLIDKEFLPGSPLILDLTKPRPEVINGRMSEEDSEKSAVLHSEQKEENKLFDEELILPDNLPQEIYSKEGKNEKSGGNCDNPEKLGSKLIVKINKKTIGDINKEKTSLSPDNDDDLQAEYSESDEASSDCYSSSGTDEYLADEDSFQSSVSMVKSQNKRNQMQKGSSEDADTMHDTSNSSLLSDSELNLLTKKTMDEMIGTDLQSRIEKMVKSNIITCEVCGKMFDDKTKYKYHIENHRKRKNHVCPTCGRGFLDGKRLLCHMSSHTGDKLFSCKVCGKKLSQMSGMNRHMRVHTGEKPYTCGVCKKSFTTHGSLKVHMRLHTGEKPFKCNICGNTFTARSTLWSHEKIHTGEKDLECKVCGKHFTLNSTLKKHLLIHDENYTERFACDICGKEYSYRNSMQRHRKTHAMVEEKPFTCEICGNKYAMLSSLKRHNEIHFRGELTKDYNCEYCHKTFAYKSSVVLHMKRTHKLKADGTPLDCDSTGMFIVPSDDGQQKVKVVSHDEDNENDSEEELLESEETDENNMAEDGTNKTSQKMESLNDESETFLYALDLVKREIQTIYNKQDNESMQILDNPQNTENSSRNPSPLNDSTCI